MIKCEIVDGAPAYKNEAAHIVFYYNDHSKLQYVIGEPILIGNTVTHPDAVKQLITRGLTIDSAYEIEPSDVSVLRGIYESTRTNISHF